jgi:hypothetical protein
MLTLDEQLLFVTGGVECESVVLRDVAFSAFRSDALRIGDALVYLQSRANLVAISLRAPTDATDWSELLAIRHPQLGPRTGLRALRRALVGTAGDPLLVYSIYDAIYRFVGRGERVVRYPEWKAGGARMSMTYRVVPAPWGVEHAIDGLVGTRLMNLDIALRLAEDGSSQAVEITAMDIPLGTRIRLGSALAAWRQPTLQVVGVTSSPELGPIAPTPSVGASFELLAEVRVDRWLLGLRAGHKSVGYSPGMAYGGGITCSVTAAVAL